MTDEDRTRLLDALAELLTCFHYDPERGQWYVEVIKDTSLVATMMPVTARLFEAIRHGKEELGEAMMGERPGNWWELEGG